jgi:5-methylthioribose kinase
VTALAQRFTGGPAYAPLGEGTLRPALAEMPGVAEVLGGEASAWRVREVGDGNLNLVFVVEGPAGGLVLKQALPYVRLVGDSWPLPLDRAYFEHEALLRQEALAPGLTPRVIHFDAARAAIVMELLQPHIILRKGLIRGLRYAGLAQTIGRFCARTLFGTSDLAVPAGEKRERVSLFSLNTELCRITEDLVFTDPYRIAPLNRWTSPQLDGRAAAIRADAALKVAAQELKWAFLSRSEAMIHGDLHTGSIMVTETDTRVIDPEFAVYGPMGFDTGAFVANLLLAYFAQDGHDPQERREGYRAWILETLVAFWETFEREFLALWQDATAGDAFPPSLFGDPASAEAMAKARAATMRRLFADTLGFAGAKMIRRILGLAHVEDLESIADPDLRARCEGRALDLARMLMLGRDTIGSAGAVRALAEAARQGV